MSKVHDAWFEEDGVRNIVGLLETPVVQDSNAREVRYLELLNWSSWVPSDLPLYKIWPNFLM